MTKSKARSRNGRADASARTVGRSTTAARPARCRLSISSRSQRIDAHGFGKAPLPRSSTRMPGVTGIVVRDQPAVTRPRLTA